MLVVSPFVFAAESCLRTSSTKNEVRHHLVIHTCTAFSGTAQFSPFSSVQ